MEDKAFFDCAVIGLGAMGSAAMYQLSARGAKVIGFDSFQPPHRHGSSHGDTRITRLGIGEGTAYVPLVMRSHEIWRELEHKSGRSLLHSVGGLIICSSNSNDKTHGVEGFLDQTISSAKEYNIAHQVLDGSELLRRFPQFRFRGDERAYFEQEAGYLIPEACIEVQLALAKKQGALLRFNSQASYNYIGKDHIKVSAEGETFRCRRLIISAGAWLKQLLTEGIAKQFKTYRQVLYWFETEQDIQHFYPDKFPIYIWHVDNEDEHSYGFPAINGTSGGIKVARESYDRPCTANDIDRSVSEQEIHETQAIIQKYLQIGKKCLRAETCLYTVSPDSKFVIDQLPNQPEILLASPCSGHGFKHSAAIGEALSQLALENQSNFDLSEFSLSRFN